MTNTKTIPEAKPPTGEPVPVEQTNIPVNPNHPNLPNLPNKPLRPIFRPQNIRPISYHGTGHRG